MEEAEGEHPDFIEARLSFDDSAYRGFRRPNQWTSTGTNTAQLICQPCGQGCDTQPDRRDTSNALWADFLDSYWPRTTAPPQDQESDNDGDDGPY